VKSCRFHSPDPETSRALGESLGRSIGDRGIAIALIGPLGAGKTLFVKGLAAGLGVDPRLVSSPTFVIAQQYPVPTGPRWLHHIDFYRLESETELETVGFYDMLAPGAVVAVEWADRFPEALGSDFLEIRVTGPGAGKSASEAGAATVVGRSFDVSAHGAEAEVVAADWLDRVELEQGSATSKAAGTAGTRRAAEMRALLLLAIAALGWGLAAGGTGAAPPLCESPRELAHDALGTTRVGCAAGDDVEHVLARVPAGVGGLLFGRGIDPNHASAALLETLPGIGPGRAAAIIEARSRAPFESLEALERVDGIGPKTRRRVAPWLTVDGRASPRPAAGDRNDHRAKEDHGGRHD